MRIGTKPVVRVLGAGPAGLLAAHAAEERGYRVDVFSAPNDDGYVLKSRLHGCQYLHKCIPGVTMDAKGPQRLVSYQLQGTAEGYRRKVYGESWEGSVSPDEFGPEKDHYAWDLRKAYDLLWSRWVHRIKPLRLDAKLAERAAAVKHTITFSSIPAPFLCSVPEHKFVSRQVWAMGTGPQQQYELPFVAPDMTVLCNGEDQPRWYRAATVFGHSTIEWPEGVKPPIHGVAAVRKPLSTDCTCLQARNWYRIGRYGTWRKGVLTHEAYETVKRVL